MPIKYIKKADKTASTDEEETRQRVQDILKDIEKRRDDGIREISRKFDKYEGCLLYTSPSPRDGLLSRMPSSA